MCNLFCSVLSLCFFFNDTATTEIYTLSLHDALPISASAHPWRDSALVIRSAGHHGQPGGGVRQVHGGDRHRSGSPRGDDATFCAGLSGSSSPATGAAAISCRCPVGARLSTVPRHAHHKHRRRRAELSGYCASEGRGRTRDPSAASTAPRAAATYDLVHG